MGTDYERKCAMTGTIRTTADPQPLARTITVHAARLSNIRNLLNTAASAAACARTGSNPQMVDQAFGYLIREVDDAVDALHGFCFPQPDDQRAVEELLALTLAAQHAKAGDLEQATQVLAETFHRPLKAVS